MLANAKFIAGLVTLLLAAAAAANDYTVPPDLADENLCDKYGHLCQNGATCVKTAAFYKCVCPTGFTGLLCQAPTGTDYCNSHSPCLNGGVCSEGANGFPNCTCASGFTGFICHKNINDCSPNPCQHNSICLDRIDDYLCVCKNGWEGKDCSNDTNECLNSPCHANADCTNTPGSFSCSCKTGYYGNGYQCYELSVLPFENATTVPQSSFGDYTISTMKIDSDIPFLIGEVESSTCTISKDGYLSFSDPPYQLQYVTYYKYLTKPIVFPYWSYRYTFGYSDSAVYYELLERETHNETSNYRKIKEILSQYNESDGSFEPLNALIVTWNKMMPYSYYSYMCTRYCRYYYEERGQSWGQYYCRYCDAIPEYLTFQAIVTRNETHSYLIVNLGEFQFNNWRWYYYYTASGYSDGNQRYQLLPYSYTWWRYNKELDSLRLGNVGKRGRHALTLATEVPPTDKLKCRRWTKEEKKRQIEANTNCDNCPRDMRQAILDWRYWPYKYTCDKRGAENKGFYWLNMCFRGSLECRQNFTNYQCRWPSWRWWCRWQQCQYFVAPRCCYKLKVHWKRDNVLYDYCQTGYTMWQMRWRLRNEMFTREESGSLIKAARKAGYSLIFEKSNSNYYWFTNYDEQYRSESYGLDTCQAAKTMGRFKKVRPKCTSDNYTEPTWGFNRGDPHISTADGRTYTFNGLGEYHMLRNSTESVLLLELQARTGMAASVNPNVTSRATVFVGFALKAGRNNCSIAVLYNSTGNDIDVYRDDQLIGSVADYFSGEENDTVVENYSIAASDNSSVTVSETDTGFSITVTRVLSFLQASVQMDNDKHGASVQGLMGNFNGNDIDDFQMRNGTLLPADSSERQLFEFGQSWLLTNEDVSHFPYLAGQTRATFTDTSFVPVFVEDYKDRLLELFSNNTELMTSANTTCWHSTESVYLSCMYDAAQLQTVSAAEESVLSVKKEVAAKAVAANRAPQFSMPENVTVFVNSVFNISIVVSDPDGNAVSLSVEEPSNDTSVWLDGNTLVWQVGQLNDTSLTVQAVDSVGAPSQWTPVVLYCHCVNGGECSFDYANGDSAVGATFYSAQCNCPDGYQGDSCQVAPCDAEPNPCYNSTMCHMRNNGTYYCDKCPDGMTGDGSLCEDINECLETPTICQENCTNQVPGYECSCSTPGYQVSSTNHSLCVDIDECSTGNHTCRSDQNQTCVNTIGSYRCECQQSGYEVDALGDCADIDECTLTSGVCGDGECVNTPGSYYCTCEYGKLKIDGACKSVLIVEESGSSSTTTTNTNIVIAVGVVGGVVVIGIVIFGIFMIVS